MRSDAGEAAMLEQPRDLAVLTEAVLEEQRSARRQMERGARDDGGKSLEARAAPHESDRGLRGEALERGVAVGDVRRIRHDQIEALAGHGIEPGPLAPLDVIEREGAPVLARHVEGGRRYVDADHPGEGPLRRDGES